MGLLHDFESQIITRRTGPNSTFSSSAVTNDPAIAKDWFGRSAKQGYGPALYRLSVLEYGRKNPRKPSEAPADSNPVEARRHLEAAALLGVPEAMASMTAKNINMFGETENLVEAYRWALLGAPPSSGREQFSFIPMLEQKMSAGQITEARKLAAKTRFPVAKPEVLRWHELVYFQNPGPSSLAPADSTNVFQNLLTEAEKGNALAQFNLALSLQHDSYITQENTRQFMPPSGGAMGPMGPVGPMNAVIFDQSQTRDGRAVKWFELAANQGHRDAQYHLAWMHLNGRGTAEDKLKSRQFFELAARQNHTLAKYQLVLLMEQGIGTPKVMTEVVRLLREAADDGHQEAAKKLALLLPSTGRVTAAAGAPATMSPANARPRLAILSLADGLASTADLLMAKLSTEAGVELLDRQEIDKVLKEQSLTPLQSGDLVRLGQLLRADGFLLLQSLSQAGKPYVQVRLLATGPGVAVSQWVYPLPLTDPVQWSDLLGRQLVPYFSKLLVGPQHAVPLSILNLRSGISSRSSEEQERQLTFLLVHRLLRAPEIFVLERQRLERLSEEKQLAGSGGEAFWNGSYLLDGIINRDGEEPGRVTVHARLISRQQKTNEVFVSGTTAALPVLIDQLVGKLAPFLNQTNQAQTWNPVEEAAYYFEEARWAMRWNMFAEAQQASEASWALGLRLYELRQMRVTAYERAATTSTGTRYIIDERVEKVELAPDPGKLDTLIRALDLYLESSTPPQLQGLHTNTTSWYAAGAELLKRSAQVLEHFYLFPASWQGSAEKLAVARNRTKELSAVLLAAGSLMSEVTRQQSYGLILAQGSLWETDAQQAVQTLEQHLNSGLMSAYLKSAGYSALLAGCWYDWSAGPRKASPLKLTALLERMIGTGPVSRQMEACVAGVLLAATNADFARWIGQLADLCLQHQEALIKGELDDRPWTAVNAYVMNGRSSFGLAYLYKLSPGTREEHAAKLKNVQAVMASRKSRAQETAALAKAQQMERDFITLKTLLQGAEEIPFRDRSKYAVTAYTLEQARELRALLPEYEKRLGVRAGTSMSLRLHLDRIITRANAPALPPVTSPGTK